MDAGGGTREAFIIERHKGVRADALIVGTALEIESPVACVANRARVGPAQAVGRAAVLGAAAIFVHHVQLFIDSAEADAWVLLLVDVVCFGGARALVALKLADGGTFGIEAHAAIGAAINDGAAREFNRLPTAIDDAC